MSFTALKSELSELSNLISERMGIDFAGRKLSELQRGIERAATALGHKDCASCIKWLLSTPLTQDRIETLASYLTIGETYFFRDEKTLKVIEESVLPEVIRGAYAANKVLRIWSAGCSTGEEPYSIAIMLRRNIPDLSEWNVTILGTDINPAALRKAEEGTYSEWSFRGIPALWKKKYFEQESKGRYQLLHEIKRLVTFSYHNLAQDPFPSLLNNTNAMNVIICRNVLMYFSAAVRQRVVRNFTHALVETGWLLSSPAESALFEHSSLKKVVVFGALVHRKDTAGRVNQTVDGGTRLNSLKGAERKDGLSVLLGTCPWTPNPSDRTLPPSSGSSDKTAQLQALDTQNGGGLSFEEAQRLYEQGRYEELIAEFSSANGPWNFAHAQYGRFAGLAAPCLANVGKLDDALKSCGEAIQFEKTNASFHYLCATIKQEMVDSEAAMKSFQTALYLDPDFTPAHFALANLARSINNLETSQRHFRNVLALLEKYDNDDPIPEMEGLTAARLRAIVHAISGAV